MEVRVVFFHIRSGKSDGRFSGRLPKVLKHAGCRRLLFHRQTGISTCHLSKELSKILDSHSLPTATPTKPRHGDETQTLRRRLEQPDRCDNADGQCNASVRQRAGNCSHHNLLARAKQGVSTAEAATSAGQFPLQPICQPLPCH